MTALGAYGDERRQSGAARRCADRRLLAAAPTALLVAAVALLAGRRIGGALTVPPTFATAALCALAAGALSIAARALGGRSVGLVESIARAASPAAVAASLSLRQTSTAALAALWLPAVAIAAGALLERVGRRAGGSGVELEDAAPSDVARRRITFEMTRSIDAAGRETIEGRARAEFEAGRRWTAIHLAFCPPLAARPTIEAALESDVEAEVKIVQALPYAARLDVKLREPPDEPTTVVVAYRAVSPPRET